MAYISFQPHDHFDIPQWAGSDSTTTVSGMEFKPDIIWIKRYDGNGHPVFNDSSKGIGFNWIPSGNNANDTTNYIASYTSDGFTLTGNINNSNDASQNYLAACFKVNGASKTTNDAGANGASIASTYQANTTSGVSIVEYTGGGAAATIAHGLGVAPRFILVKNTAIADRGTTLNMSTMFVSDPETDNMQFALNSSTLSDQSNKWNDTAPTTSVFSVGDSNMVSGNTQAHVAYCFAEVPGFSNFGYYAGNNNTNGPYVYTGFRPKYVLIKNTEADEDWALKLVSLPDYALGGESKRTIKYGVNAPSTNCTINYHSNGFQIATTDGKANGDGVKYFYIAFADMPVVGSNGVPSLAI